MPPFEVFSINRLASFERPLWTAVSKGDASNFSLGLVEPDPGEHFRLLLLQYGAVQWVGPCQVEVLGGRGGGGGALLAVARGTVMQAVVAVVVGGEGSR